MNRPKRQPFWIPEEGCYGIPLSICGLVALIDECDLEKVSGRNWSAQGGKKGVGAEAVPQYYACASTGEDRKVRLLHRFLLDAKAGEIIDHINRDTLDNRRSNLRFVSRSENRMNTNHYRGSSVTGYLGVVKVNGALPFLTRHQKRIVGFFPTPEMAAAAYDRAVRASFDICSLNFSDEDYHKILPSLEVFCAKRATDLSEKGVTKRHNKWSVRLGAAGSLFSQTGFESKDLALLVRDEVLRRKEAGSLYGKTVR